MNVYQLLTMLDAHEHATLRFLLPSGVLVPAHFHVTEVGRVEKRFIDCGGIRRESSSCLLQVWTANDMDHRLLAGKLAKIIRLDEPLLQSYELPVEVEYGEDVAAQYQLNDLSLVSQGLLLVLAGKQTDCLAPDKCGISSVGANKAVVNLH